MFARFGREGSGPGEFKGVSGLCALADGSGFVIADSGNGRLCVHAPSGEFVRAVGGKEQGLVFPFSLAECDSDAGFTVINLGVRGLIRVSRDGERAVKVDDSDPVARMMEQPGLLVGLPNDSCLVLDGQWVRYLASRMDARRIANEKQAVIDADYVQTAQRPARLVAAQLAAKAKVGVALTVVCTVRVALACADQCLLPLS